MGRKGNVGLVIVVIVLALIILAAYLINIAQRECGTNQDCGEAAYCGSDYACHSFPEQIVVRESNFLPAAVVFGICLIIAAWMVRKKRR